MKHFIVIASIFYAGCAQTWVHPSKGEDEFYADLAKCEAMSNSAGDGQMLYGGNAFANGYNQGAAIGGGFAKKRLFKNCMRGEGWRPQ